MLQLLNEHINPLVTLVLRSKLQSPFNQKDRGSRNQDIEEAYHEIQRHVLEDKIRYCLTSNDEFALWESAGSEWLSGLSHWKTSTKRASASGSERNALAGALDKAEVTGPDPESLSFIGYVGWDSGLKAMTRWWGARHNGYNFIQYKAYRPGLEDNHMDQDQVAVGWGTAFPCIQS